MTQKKKIFIALAVVLFLLLLFWLVWFLTNQKKPVAVNSAPVVNSQTVVTRENDGEPTVPPVEEVKVTNSELQGLAYTFAERYGSFSNQTDFANLRDVLPLMSGALKTQTENYIASASTAGEYYGITTRVLSIKVISDDGTSGVVEVSTQREESKSNPNDSQVKYQKLVLNYSKEAEVWKVVSAVWQ